MHVCCIKSWDVHTLQLLASTLPIWDTDSSLLLLRLRHFLVSPAACNPLPNEQAMAMTRIQVVAIAACMFASILSEHAATANQITGEWPDCHRRYSIAIAFL